MKITIYPSALQCECGHPIAVASDGLSLKCINQQCQHFGKTFGPVTVTANLQTPMDVAL